MTSLTREMLTLLTDGREYRVAYAMTNGEWDVVDRFMALDDDAANAYAKTWCGDGEWYVLDASGRNINGGAA
jgi:transglutaminase-like putative cysteine protease